MKITEKNTERTSVVSVKIKSKEFCHIIIRKKSTVTLLGRYRIIQTSTIVEPHEPSVFVSFLKYKSQNVITYQEKSNDVSFTK